MWGRRSTSCNSTCDGWRRQPIALVPGGSNLVDVGRHPLGADSVGYSKAEQLAKKLRTCFPHGKFDSKSEGFGEVLAKEPLLLLNSDLIVCATGIWTVEGTVNAWHRSGMGPSQVMYAWTEPHACAGHAVAVERSSACLQCQFTRLGDAKTNITDWGKSEPKHEPACGAVYQPYGPIELSWTTALASALALDCLLGKISTSTHRIWAAPNPCWSPRVVFGTRTGLAERKSARRAVL